MADELIDIFDEDMNQIGSAMKYQAHAEGLWHKIFFLFSEESPKISIFGLVFDEKDNYIREKREVSIADFMDYGKTTYRDFFLDLKKNLNI